MLLHALFLMVQGALKRHANKRAHGLALPAFEPPQEAGRSGNGRRSFRLGHTSGNPRTGCQLTETSAHRRMGHGGCVADGDRRRTVISKTAPPFERYVAIPPWAGLVTSTSVSPSPLKFPAMGVASAQLSQSVPYCDENTAWKVPSPFDR
jgi:hypothetical protein